MALPPVDFGPLALWLDLIGTFVFGLSGGMLAVRKQLDLFGIVVLSVAAATAGGAIRDMAIGDQPIAFLRDQRYLIAAFAAGITAFLAHRLVERLNKPVMLLDAVGLGVFAVTGSQKALAFGLSPASACIVGVLTAVGGGVVRDILVAEVPRVLREDIYAVAAILGTILVIVGTRSGWPEPLTVALGFGVTFTARVLSVRLNLRLPRAR